MDSAERWRLAAHWRPQFAAAARREGASWADAEDAAAHAVEVVGTSDLTEIGRLRALGLTSAVNACRAQHRDRLRQTQRGLRAIGRPEEPDAAERICDRAEAAWAAELASELKPSWQRILTLRAAGLPVAEIARQLHLKTRSVEMQLLRARHALAAQVIATRSLLVAAVHAVRRASRAGSADRVRRGATAATTGVAVLVLVPRLIGGVPPSQHPTPPQTRPVNATPTRSTTSPPQHDVLPVPLPPLPPLPTPSELLPIKAYPGVTGRYGTGASAHNDETLAEAVFRCLRDGPRISTQGVGCPP